MKTTPINNINSNNTNFGHIRIVGRIPKKYSEMFNNSLFGRSDQNFLAIPTSLKVSKYDFNHQYGTRLYRFKIVKQPQGFMDKFLLRLGFPRAVYLTNGFHSDNSTEAILKNDIHVKDIIDKLNEK